MIPIKRNYLPLILIFIFVQLNCQKPTVHTQSGNVQHIVFCWLSNPGDEAAKQKIIDTSKSFEKIPGVLRVFVGGAISSERPVVDDSFDIGIIITCKNREALQNYQQHPQHIKASKEVLQPLVSKILVYDIDTAK